MLHVKGQRNAIFAQNAPRCMQLGFPSLHVAVGCSPVRQSNPKQENFEKLVLLQLKACLLVVPQFIPMA